MLIEEESIKTLEKAIADFKEAIAKSENICFDTAITANSASAQLSNLAKRMKAEKGETPEELLSQILNYIQKKYKTAISDYARLVLVPYYYLLRCAKSISKNIATREQKQELEKLQKDIDEYDDIRERVITQLQSIMSDIAKRHWPEQMAPAEYKSIAGTIEDYMNNFFEDRQGNKIPPLTEDLDTLGAYIKRQIEIRFMELLKISEKLLGSAKAIADIKGTPM